MYSSLEEIEKGTTKIKHVATGGKIGTRKNPFEERYLY